MIFCANVGDSRAVLCRNGKAINLSKDHKVSNEEELQRVQSLGGSIICGRLEGRIAVTRAFGDQSLKKKATGYEKPFLTSEPEIRYSELDYDPIRIVNSAENILAEKKDDFIVLGSDGLFDALSS